MKKLHNLLTEPLVLLFLLFVGGFLFFANLSWGEPLFFHPDERNIVSAISQLHAPDQMHPHFFAYGSLPLYAIYFVGVLSNFFLKTLHTSSIDIFTVTFEQAILIARGFSAMFAILLIPVLYRIGKTLKNPHTGLLAASLFILSVGIVQYAHFGTFEMWLTFFSVLLFWLCLSYQKAQKTLRLLGIGLCLGALIAIKISSLIFIPLVLLVLSLAHLRVFIHSSLKKRLHLVAKVFFAFCFVLCTAGIVYVATNPYVFLATNDFRGSMKYESEVALGSLPVFYTGEFFDTIPVLYHLVAVYPFLLNPLVLLLFGISSVWLIYTICTKRTMPYLLLLLFFLILFFSQTFLFVKWTRYLVPTLPFVYLITALYLQTLLTGKTIRNTLPGILFIVCVFMISSLFVISYVKTVLLSEDTRMVSAAWAQKRIPNTAPIASEVYDLGITAFNPYFQDITLINVYDLDTQDKTFQQTERTKMFSAEYIVMPSQRIYKTRLTNRKKFPEGYKLYKHITQSQQYIKIYETPCDVFCRILYIGDAVFRFEGTANVFDRPTVMIYQKRQ